MKIIKISKEINKFIKEYNFISIRDLEEILESLEDMDCLTDKGKKFRLNIWKLFIKE